MSKVLVTGGNRGIGLEICRQLSARGDDVIATCRKSTPELNMLNVQVIQDIDVSRAHDIPVLQKALGNTKLDMLIHNAGILLRDSLDTLDFDHIETQFRVNTLGPLRVIHGLQQNLVNGSKIGIVSSRMGSIDDNSSGGYYGYRISKAAVNMAGVNLARDLEPRGIAVILLHPGMVATEMTDKNGIPPEQAAQGLIERVDRLDMENSGSFYHADGSELPW